MKHYLFALAVAFMVVAVTLSMGCSAASGDEPNWLPKRIDAGQIELRTDLNGRMWLLVDIPSKGKPDSVELGFVLEREQPFNPRLKSPRLRDTEVEVTRNERGDVAAVTVRKDGSQLVALSASSDCTEELPEFVGSSIRLQSFQLCHGRTFAVFNGQSLVSELQFSAGNEMRENQLRILLQREGETVLQPTFDEVSLDQVITSR